jgi:DNA-binding response OmpR family regulator
LRSKKKVSLSDFGGRRVLMVSMSDNALMPAPFRPSPSAPEVFSIGPALIDRRTRHVTSPNGERRLRRKELQLVLYLYEHLALTFSRETLLQLVWECHPDLVTRTVDQTVATLRQKIEPDPKQPRFLQTVHGIGYRLVLSQSQ